MTQNLDDSILILTMSGEHGCLVILVGGGGEGTGRFELVAGHR